MKRFNKGKTSAYGLVADVDCTTEGKELCEKAGVKGYPSIKWGHPDDLQEYDGGRDFKTLSKFAKENLKPLCGPANEELCNEEEKAKFAELKALSAEELEAKVAEKDQETKDANEKFEAEVKKLQETYEQLQKDKDSALAAIKESGLGAMKAMQAHNKKLAGGDKKEETVDGDKKEETADGEKKEESVDGDKKEL